MIKGKNIQERTVANWLSLRKIKRHMPRSTSIKATEHNFCVKFVIISIIVAVSNKPFTHIILLKPAR